ncbi:MAG: diguanylate cyclase [Deltaproteobacteria bacterium]|nr:diguanylate cyclase [Deltaproteobacteria bacterium]
MKGKILVADDDAFFRVLCSDILTAGGFSVKSVSTGMDAVKVIESEPIDIVITDLVMPDIGGIEVLQRTKQHNTLTDVIVITGHGSIETAIEALKNGASDYIRKPLNEDELLHTVNSCIEKKKLLEENQEMRQSLKLFEVCRAVTATIDISKLYNISLDALLQMIPGEAGIIIFYEDEMKKLDIKAIRHLGIDAGEQIVKAFMESYGKDLQGPGSITVLSKPELKGDRQEALKDYNSLLIAPIIKGKGTIGFIIILSMLGKDGYTIRDIKNADFIVEHASGAFENAQKYSEAKEMAFIDSLTNLYNSKYLETVLEKELKRADRLMMPVTVLFLDLDNFKRINDTNDHLIGSKVLIEVGKILLKCVREVDTVIRYGGDEYVIILVDADYDVAGRVAERIRSSIEKNSFLEEESLNVRITVSIGIATYPVHTKDKKELLKIADKAMYRAKDISRNMVYLAPVPGLNEPIKK